MRPQRAPMTVLMHARFLSALGDRVLARHTDGGASDRNRSRKRRVAKAQRQPRSAQRSKR